jgi:UTP--glucose-1-phosphate uridylyltransferase
MKVRKAVIPAAGYGTRFLPITKAVPKEMLPVIDKPAIQYVAEEALNSGITELIFVVSENKQAIENYFRPNAVYDNLADRTLLNSIDGIMSKANIKFVLQKPMRGNGDAVLVAKEAVGDEPFAVMFGDDVMYTAENERPVTGQLCDIYEKTGADILGVQRCAPEIAARCGVIKPGKTDGKLTEVVDLVEKPPINELPSDLASFGRFVLTPEIFYELEHAPLFRNEIYLTVALRSLMKKHPCFAYEFDGKRYDLGNKLGFLEANIEYCMRSADYGEKMKRYIKELAKRL